MTIRLTDVELLALPFWLAFLAAVIDATDK